MQHQQLEKGILLRRQSNQAPAAKGGMIECVQLQILELHLRRSRLLKPSEQGVQTSQQNRKIEWFGEIVVGAAVQAADDILDIVHRRQEQDRRLKRLCPQFTAN